MPFKRKGVVMAGIHRERPGAADLATATDTPATPLGNDVWMSPGVSNSYAVATGDGRVIVNGGLVFEGSLHRKAFADVPGPCLLYTSPGDIQTSLPRGVAGVSVAVARSAAPGRSR